LSAGIRQYKIGIKANEASLAIGLLLKLAVARLRNNQMIIGGLEKLSLLDYPGQIAAIVFTQGCNFRCHFCYNPMLVLPLSRTNIDQKDSSLINKDDLFAFLEDRRGKLDAVVITGGEPTIHQDLPEFIEAIKKLGFLVKLDTNGTNPEMLEKLLDKKLLDYIAMDVKAPFDKYENVVGVKIDLNKIKKSVKIIMESGLPYEFRTTVAPALLEPEDVVNLATELKGATKWYLQKFEANKDLLDSKLVGTKIYSNKEMKQMAEAAASVAGVCLYREY
jgi:pyruvate formate lyase activating enzyme